MGIGCVSFGQNLQFQSNNEKFDFVFGDLTDVPMNPDCVEQPQTSYVSSPNHQVSMGRLNSTLQNIYSRETANTNPSYMTSVIYYLPLESPMLIEQA